MNTGNRPIPSLEYPRLRRGGDQGAGRPARPAAVRGDPEQHRRWPASSASSTPRSTRPALPRPASRSRVRGISLGNGLTVEEIETRQQPARPTSTRRSRRYETNSDLLDGPRPVLRSRPMRHHQLAALARRSTSARSRRRSPSSFGETPFGMSCLLATRLVEAGVRFVTRHARRLGHAPQQLHAAEDQPAARSSTAGLAACSAALDQKGLLDTTAVFVTGEFGRTPKINSRDAEGGRDHYPRCHVHADGRRRHEGRAR